MKTRGRDLTTEGTEVKFNKNLIGKGLKIEERVERRLKEEIEKSQKLRKEFLKREAILLLPRSAVKSYQLFFSLPLSVLHSLPVLLLSQDLAGNRV